MPTAKVPLPSDATPPTIGALRSATAAVVALLVGEFFRLEHTNLAVWTTHMVMTQYAFSSFQKGVERVLGRGLGILGGLVLLTLWRNTITVAYVLEAVSLLVFFYIYFSNRLAYTFLNAGLYMAVIIDLGRTNPEAVFPEGWALFLAIVVGVVVANLVSWYTGLERDLTIHTEGLPLWPVDGERLEHSVLLVAAVALALGVTDWLALPTTTTLVSVMLLVITPDIHELVWKGELRLAGALLAAAYALLALILLVRLPHFSLLAALLFLGMYLGAYLARAGGQRSYAGVQMGLVLPMVLVVPPADCGNMSSATSRLLGVVIAIGCSMVVSLVAAVFWGRESRRQAATANAAAAGGKE
ncbi:MAG TPA: FUSC family protein [Pirellulales bacterium]|nr:FUSC family protein [Pirellulales bacterium]